MSRVSAATWLGKMLIGRRVSAELINKIIKEPKPTYTYQQSDLIKITDEKSVANDVLLVAIKGVGSKYPIKLRNYMLYTTGEAIIYRKVSNDQGDYEPDRMSPQWYICESNTVQCIDHFNNDQIVNPAQTAKTETTIVINSFTKVLNYVNEHRWVLARPQIVEGTQSGLDMLVSGISQPKRILSKVPPPPLSSGALIKAEAKMQECEDRIKESKAENARLVKEIEKLQASNSKVIEKAKENLQAVQSEREFQISEFQKEIERLKEENGKIQEEVVIAKEVLQSNHEREVQILKDANTQLQLDIEALLDVEDPKLSEYKDKIEKLTQENTRIVQITATLGEKMLAQQDELKRANDRISILEADILRLLEENKECESNLSKWKSKWTTEHEAAEKWQEGYNTTQKQLLDRGKAYETLLQEFYENRNASESLVKAMKQIEELEKEKHEFIKRLKTADFNYRDLENKYNIKEREYLGYRKKCDDTTTDYMDRIKKLEEQVQQALMLGAKGQCNCNSKKPDIDSPLGGEEFV